MSQERIEQHVTGLLYETAALIALSHQDASAVAKEAGFLRDARRQIDRILSRVEASHAS